MKEQVHCSQRRCREHHRVAGEPLWLFLEPASCPNGTHFVTAGSICDAIQGFHIHDSGLRKNPSASLFRKKKVIQVKSIFRTVATPHHAAGTTDASSSRWTFSAKKWISKGVATRFAFRSLENSHTGAVEGASHSHFFSR